MRGMASGKEGYKPQSRQTEPLTPTSFGAPSAFLNKDVFFPRTRPQALSLKTRAGGRKAETEARSREAPHSGAGARERGRGGRASEFQGYSGIWSC